jgi:DNA-binding HxlR family transcriptional regulator
MIVPLKFHDATSSTYNALMKRASFEGMNCSLARALEEIGEWWTLLIIREAIWGTARFDDFHLRLGIARNILATRLAKLEALGIMTRTATSANARIFDYALTDKGRDLFAPIVALMQWGDRWIHHKTGAPIEFFDSVKGLPVQPVAVRNSKGQPLAATQVNIRPGPGARKSTRQRAQAAALAATGKN